MGIAKLSDEFNVQSPVDSWLLASEYQRFL